MKTISLKLDDTIFSETEGIVAQLQLPRNRYINEAVDYYNKIHKRKKLKQKLEEESLMVKEDSMSVLEEFEVFEYES